MPRYIDADALEKILAYWIEEKGYARKKHSGEFVKGMEDAYHRVLCFVKMEPKMEVVRCKECKHCGDDHFCCYPWCTAPDEFCSRGERREDG